jgi:UDP-glucose 4-epimerase
VKLLLTGGAGFIGSKIAARCLAAGHEVVVLDNLSTGFRDNVPSGAKFVEADLSKPDFLKKIPAGKYDAVLHLAAQSSGEVSAEDPAYDFAVNAASTILLSRWCVERGVKRFLYASSMSVYGHPESSPVSEIAPCLPLTQYGVSKLASEHALRLADAAGVRVTAFRMFSVYGPGQNMANLKQGMVSIYLAYLLDGKEVPVKGSLARFRDLIYIDDVVDAWLAALGKKETPSLVYNLGGGKPTKVAELLAALKKACGLPETHPVKELPGTPGDQFGLFADVRRAKAELGFAPKISLDDGLARMVAWARPAAGAKR